MTSTPTTGAGGAPPGPSPERIALLRKAIEHWRRQLIDASRRNNLLFYRDTKTTTLRLDDLAPSGRERLLRGAEIGLTDLIPSDLVGEDRDELAADLQKRARTIFQSAQTNKEEAGLDTLYIGVGLATWELGDDANGRNPAAPVLLMPVSLTQKGSGAMRSYTIVGTDELVLNPVLVHHLKEVGIPIDVDALISGIGGLEDGEPGMETSADAQEVFRRLTAEVERLQDFQVLDSVVLGNFQYYKMAMVEDLERYAEQLALHPIVAAIAGDEQARREAVPPVEDPEPRDFDDTPAVEQNLILDSDSSQELAIRRVLQGQSTVIQGPPGTGKSQTISNLMASLAAEGKRVLFVAEKRAALDAVKKRLDVTGLGHLVLDLHGRGVTKKKLAAQMAEGLQRIRQSRPDEAAELYRQHDKSCEVLRANHDSVHRLRDPYGRSVYELRCAIAGTQPEARLTCDWSDPAIVSLYQKQDTVRDLIDSLTEFSDLLSGQNHGWWSRTTVSNETVGRRVAQVEACQKSWKKGRGAIAEIGMAVGEHEPLRRSTEVRERLSRHIDVVADYQDSVWSAPLEQLARTLRSGSGSAVKRLATYLSSKPYREARKQLLDHRKANAAPWADLPTEAARLSAATRAWSKDTGATHPPVTGSVLAAREAMQQLENSLQELAELVPGEWHPDSIMGDVEDSLGAMVADRQTPYRMARLEALERRIEAEAPELNDLRTRLALSGLDPDLWIAAFEHALADATYQAIVRTDPTVQGFEGTTHGKVVDRYQEADRRLMEATALRVVRSHAEHVIATCNDRPEQDALIRREARKSRSHLPLRRLLDEAPDILTALFPCWLASPLSVSQLLSGERHFDVVLFDEASQVFPHDAIPSILRGSQLVVAGDRHQLPPTYFFQGAEDDAQDPGAVEGFESLLDIVGAFLQPSPLLWHYRSRDERLIAFSNRHIYDNTLVTFPGAGLEERPLVGHVVPFRAEAFESTRSGSDEVRKVVELVLQHAEERPSESLGVIALGSEHGRRLEAQLDQQLALRPDLEEFFDPAHRERFFIKNLERVQGDERDAIILSVGYAKDRAGNLPHRFGPITQATGHRRLNVAASRARQRMTVVSSFDWDEIDTRKSKSRGVRFLRDFLRYAQSGGEILSDEGETAVPLNWFEKDVLDELAQAGIPLTPQYGCSGYRIDMVASHPERPGRYALAIECDGASYHSAPIVRERDRLRQQVLESLGWRFHRIWSTDWWNHREREVEAAVAAYNKAVRMIDAGLDHARDETGLSQTSLGLPESNSVAPSGAPQRTARPHFVPGQAITEYSHATLVRLVEWVQSDGQLHTDKELINEVARELGYKRKGNRIVNRLQAAIDDTR